MFDRIKKLLSCPFAVLLIVGALSVFSLAMAYTAEYVYGLDPCILCLYQRIPFAIVILFVFLALVMKPFKPITKFMLFFSSLAMLGNSALAAFHSGVERKWWTFGEEGCAVPDFTQTPETLIDHIMKAPVVACDSIAWADPVFEFSMANYNIVWCFGLGAICLLSLALSARK